MDIYCILSPFMNIVSISPKHILSIFRSRDSETQSFRNVFKITSIKLEMVRAMIQTQIPLSLAFFS